MSYAELVYKIIDFADLSFLFGAADNPMDDGGGAVIDCGLRYRCTGTWSIDIHEHRVSD